MTRSTWRKYFLLAIVAWSLLLFVAAHSRAARAAESQLSVRLTWYLATGYPMYNGEYPHPGAAACSTHFALGTVLVLPAGDKVVCKDRGHINSRPWVDVYVNNRTEGHLLTTFYGDETTVAVVH